MHEARRVMHDDEWVPVSHANCDQVAGPFYHGTRADLHVGDLLKAGFASNYHDHVLMNHVYFTTAPKGAGLAAEMARGAGKPRVYVVVPTGPFEDDPNVTNKKFRGNPTRSYRTAAPLRIVGELEQWETWDPEFIRELRRRVVEGMGEIIN
jgi:rifampin ADP-ribosylating transferase